MNVTLQRHCAKHIYVIPEGLRELMSDISREVLRMQPSDIYTFIADYLDALMITRENARVAARFVQEITEIAETIINFLVRTGMKREEADVIATIIQTAFRSYIEKKGILKEDENIVVARIMEEAQIPEDIAEDAAIVIQDAFRTFKQKKEKESELLRGIIDWRVAAKSAIKLYRKTGVSKEEAIRAANLIKAAYKGYYTRRALEQLRQRREEEQYSEYDSVSTSYGSGDSGEKKKGVRIDLDTVIPHVDFADATVIDVPSIDDTQGTQDTQDTHSDYEYIQAIVLDKMLSALPEEKSEMLLPTITSVHDLSEVPQATTEEVVTESAQDVADFARSLLEEILPGDN